MIIKVLRRESYGMSSDVWSVGCCVVMMATGNSPWAVNRSCDPCIDIVRVSVTIVMDKVCDIYNARLLQVSPLLLYHPVYLVRSLTGLSAVWISHLKID